MFNRSNPAGLALAFVTVIIMAAAFLALSFGVGATPGHDGVPAAYSFETGPDNQYNGYPELDTTDYGTDIPRCASDDFNADHVARCYTQRVTDGAVLIIDASDTVIATLGADPSASPAPDWTYATCDVPVADLPPYTVVHSCIDPTGAIVAR